MVAYTESVVIVCSALLLALFDEYQLRFVWPDVITFSRELGMAMEAALCSRANIREVLELPYIIVATRIDTMPET